MTDLAKIYLLRMHPPLPSIQLLQKANLLKGPIMIEDDYNQWALVTLKSKCVNLGSLNTSNGNIKPSQTTLCATDAAHISTRQTPQIVRRPIQSAAIVTEEDIFKVFVRLNFKVTGRLTTVTPVPTSLIAMLWNTINWKI